MGNTQKKQTVLENVISLNLLKISKSANPTVINFYVDGAQYPESGLIAVGNEFVENYSEFKLTNYSSFTTSSKILRSCYFNTSIAEINGKIEKTDPTLVLAFENHQIEFLHGKTLISFKAYTPVIKLSDLVFPNENIELISSNPEPFKNIYVDYMITIDETQFLVGYQGGIVQRISLPNTIVLKTYNPLLFQKDEKLVETSEKEVEEEKKNEESKLILDNFLLPGIESINYCKLYELIFVNHRKSDSNFSGRTFSLEESPILIYKINGEKYDKLRGCTGSISQSSLMENRGLYIVLTSENTINVWNYQSKAQILKIDLNKIGMKGGSETYFTTMDVNCFDINQRLITADKLYDYSEFKGSKIEHQKIEGDIIYTSERNGGLFVSKITFENEKNEISWIPMKILDMKEQDTTNKSKVLKSIKNIPNNIVVLKYYKPQDCLFMIDHKANVRIFKSLNRKLFIPKSIN